MFAKFSFLEKVIYKVRIIIRRSLSRRTRYKISKSIKLISSYNLKRGVSDLEVIFCKIKNYLFQKLKSVKEKLFETIRNIKLFYQKVKELWLEAITIDNKNPSIERSKSELEFLPAALEILETPPSKSARFFASLIMSFLVIAVIWAIFSKVDTVAIATGNIVPKNYIKIIQSLELSSVRDIKVKVGDSVSKGQVLIELDPIENEANMEQAKSKLESLELNFRNLEIIWKLLNKQDVNISFDGITSNKDLMEDMRLQTLAQIEDYENKLKQLDTNYDQLIAKEEFTKKDLEILNKIIPLMAEQERSYYQMSKGKLISKNKWIDAKQKILINTQKKIEAESKINEIKLSIEKNILDKESLFSKTNQEVIIQINKIKTEIKDAVEVMRKAKNRHKHSTLVAPEDGTVQEINVHTIGGVVSPAQELIKIVPRDAKLQVNANILNKDIGFIKIGQDVSVKVEAFPFTRYGYIEGKLIRYGADAIEVEHLGLVFPVTISLDKSYIMAGDKKINLQSGMTVHAEIKTKKRRIISFFLEPILSHKNDSFKER